MQSITTSDLKQKLKYWYRVFLNLIRKDVWIIDGTEISTGKPLKIIFAGRVQNKFHIIKLAFDSNYNETDLGKKYFWTLIYLIKTNRSKCALAVIEGTNLDSYLYGDKKSFFVPLWLESIVTIPLEISNRSTKEDVRKIRKNKLDYYVTKDFDQIQDFFLNWHLPMIRSQHKKRTFEITFAQISQQINEGQAELLVSTKEGVPISGVLILTNNAMPQLLINGISEKKYQKVGAITSTYYFSSQHLEKLGYNKLSLANNRSFLSDGLLQYKKKWKPQVHSSDTRGYIMKPLGYSDALKGFFVNNPFTYIKNEELYGAVFISDKQALSSEEYEKYKTLYFLTGFSGLHIFSLAKDGKDNGRKNKCTFSHVNITA